jgi:hypothetical protein
LNLLTKPKKKVHFLHVGKTGGTAIKSVLSHYTETSKYTITLHGHGTSIIDIPKGEMVILFLREPISRFISGFYSRQRQGRPRYNLKWSPQERAVFEAFSTPNAIACALADGNDDAIEAMTSIQHFRMYKCWYKDFDYFESRMQDILFIGFQETLSDGFFELKSILGIPENILLPTDDIIAHKNPDNLNKSIEKRGISALEKWYKNDLVFYSMCKELMSNKAFQKASR